VLKRQDALAQLIKAHKGLISQPTQEYGLNHKSHKEIVGESFFGFGLWKIVGEVPQQPKN
jgi:hypothetical protein